MSTKAISLSRRVDDKDNLIEWITSVSMLSEGWDVKNVFQIVPHEERAFNSKLLCSGFGRDYGYLRLMKRSTCCNRF